MTKNEKPKRKIWLLARGLTSIFLLMIVLSKIEWQALLAVIRSVNFYYLFISILIAPLLIIVSSWKWQVILKAQEINYPFFKLFWLYLLGYFFNNVLPTNVGGDVIRAWMLSKKTNNGPNAYSSVFVERFSGFTVLLLMVVVSLFLVISSIWSVWIMWGFGLLLLSYMTVVVFLLKKSILEGYIARATNLRYRKILIKIEKFQYATLSLRGKWRTISIIFIASFVFYVLACLNVYFTARVFSDTFQIDKAFIITPIVLVITMLPVSIGGIGLSEGAYYYLFERLVTLGDVGFSVALLMRLKALSAGMVGWFYFLSHGFSMRGTLNSLEQIEDKPVNTKTQNEQHRSLGELKKQNRAPIAKYQEIFLGTKNLLDLINYELVTVLFGSLPGMIGLLARKIFFPTLFRSVGKSTLFGRSITLRHGKKIKIGSECIIDDYCLLSAQANDCSCIEIGDGVFIGRNSVVLTRDAQIEIGDFTNIGSNCRIGTATNLKLGKSVLIAANCYIGAGQHKFANKDVPIIEQGFENKGGVIIEDDVWLGAGVIIFDGVTIGGGSIIGAGAVVTKNIPPYSIAVGIPARVVKVRK